MVIEVLSKLTLETEIGFTVTEQVAVLSPSFVFAVIVAEPTATAVTFPFESTVAMLVFELDQVHALSVAFEGETVAVSVSVSPIINERVVLFRLMPVTEIGLTVTMHEAFLPPSSVVAETVAEPTAIAVTLPFESTVTMFVFELDQVKDLFVALEGETVAVNVSVLPISNESDDLFKLTPVTETGFTVTVQEAFFPPSSVDTVIVAEPTEIAETFPF